MQQHQPFPLNVADLTVDSFETASLGSISPQLPTSEPTAETRCFYCPPATMDCY
jgi:hypothetical protein